jgi:sigma-B regulation protein RsbU (phosphoserine phosphatase)
MVNRMLRESTDAGQFATLFLGMFAESSRRLTYINCGHNPPFLVRASGEIERLEATATVIGAFDDWGCALGRTVMAPGDRFVGYSDGLTESMRDGEAFGEARLIAMLREHRSLAPSALVTMLLSQVQEFCGGALDDDVTMVVGRAR